MIINIKPMLFACFIREIVYYNLISFNYEYYSKYVSMYNSMKIPCLVNVLLAARMTIADQTEITTNSTRKGQIIFDFWSWFIIALLQMCYLPKYLKYCRLPCWFVMDCTIKRMKVHLIKVIGVCFSHRNA